MTTRAAPIKTAAAEGVQPANVTALVCGIVFSAGLVIALGLLAAQIRIYSWDSVGGAKPSPNQLTAMAWLVMLSAAVGGLAANRLTRRIFRISAPGPIWFSTVGVAVGAVPASIWLVVHAANASGMPSTASATAGRILAVLSASVAGILVVAARPYLRLIGAGILGSTVLVLAFVIVSLFAKTGTPRLGLLLFGGVMDPETAPNYFSSLFIEAAVAAIVPAGIVAWVGRHRDQPWGEAALAGSAGTFLVGMSYLFAGNGTIDAVDQTRPWLYVQAAAILAFLVAALVAWLTARKDHVAVRPLPNRYGLWVCGAIVGAVLGMIASIVFFNLGPIPFSFGQAGQQVSGNFRTTDNSVLISASATLVGLAVAIVVLIEAVWSVVASRRRS